MNRLFGLPERAGGQMQFLHQTAPSPHSEACWIEDAWLWLVRALGLDGVRVAWNFCTRNPKKTACPKFEGSCTCFLFPELHNQTFRFRFADQKLPKTWDKGLKRLEPSSRTGRPKLLHHIYYELSTLLSINDSIKSRWSKYITVQTRSRCWDTFFFSSS